ncbi:MAG TPA: DUF6318 family protein, partial [Jiangellaceae bacterium]
LIAAGAVLLLAAGCSDGDDEPQSLPTITPSVTSAEPSPSPIDDPSPTGTPTAAADAPPEPRDGMHEYSQAGVDAFTRYVIDVINYSYRTNDVELLKAISTVDCQFCANAIERITFIDGEGGRIEGDQLEPTVDQFELIGPAEGFVTSAGVELVVTASRTIDGDGEVRNTEDDRVRYVIFDFEREDAEWRLAEVRSTSAS